MLSLRRFLPLQRQCLKPAAVKCARLFAANAANESPVPADETAAKSCDDKSDEEHPELMSVRSVTRTTVKLWKERSKRLGEDLFHGTRYPDPSELVAKAPSDSKVRIDLPFRSDPSLREEYVNFVGDLRLGLLLEDLDSLAGTIAYKHADDGNLETRPYTIVTASMDRVDLLEPISLNEDLYIEGNVVRVGYSSMELSIKLYSDDAEKGNFRTVRGVPGRPFEAATRGKRTPLLSSNFTMVARMDNKAAPVNPLQPQTEEERVEMIEAQENMERRKKASKESLFNNPFTESESKMVHDLFKEDAEVVEKTVGERSRYLYMKDTKLQSVEICMPQERNVHNKIFGGFLMRRAFELAWANAYTFAQARPRFLCMDDVTFLRPVEIGSLLVFDSEIVYANGYPSHSFDVKVRASVLNPRMNTAATTNDFHFTFYAPDTDVQLRRLLPTTIEDAVVYLEARRRHERGREISRKTGSACYRFY